MITAVHAAEPEKMPRKPVLVGEPWRVCTMPDLGELAGPDPKRQHVVDHSFIRDARGKWRLWACIRGTAAGRVIYGWEGDSLEQGPWRESGIMMRADPASGESKRGQEERIGAPHFLRVGDTWHCFYHSQGMHHATSADGVTYRRVLDADGKSRVGIPGGRDVMILPHGGKYYSYATVTTNDGKRSYVIASSSDDLRTWSKGKIVREGGKGGVGPVASESPFVVALDGYFYLFRASSHDFKTYIYRSADPLDFGINDDSNLIAEFRMKAPEVILHDGRWYISDLADFQGITLRRLLWDEDRK
jgi:hypothetical protein